jgi:hypothetical protein
MLARTHLMFAVGAGAALATAVVSLLMAPRAQAGTEGGLASVAPAASRSASVEPAASRSALTEPELSNR